MDNGAIITSVSQRVIFAKDDRVALKIRYEKALRLIQFCLSIQVLILYFLYGIQQSYAKAWSLVRFRALLTCNDILRYLRLSLSKR
jgi:hypothetical protein